MMPDPESDDRAVHGVDVGEIAFDSAGMRDRELGPYCGIEVLFTEYPPVPDDTVVLLPCQLRAPRPVVEPFVAAEEERRERAAESEWVAPVVRGDKSAIHSDPDRLAAVGPVEPQLAVRREVRRSEPEQSVRAVAATQHLFGAHRRGETLDAIEARELQSVKERRALRSEFRLSAERQRLGDESVTLSGSEYGFTIVVDRLRQLTRSRQRNGVTRNPHQNPQALIRSVLVPDALRSRLALVAPAL